METKRLQILKNSLIKKEALFNKKLQEHIDTVKLANGQPLNDKRNGRATLNIWDRQNATLRKIQEGIETTKQAIEIEESKISGVESIKKDLPSEILDLINSGVLIQWRKYPNTFFVKDVGKARIVWDSEKSLVFHRYVKEITDKEQYSQFAKIFNLLNQTVNKKVQEK